MKVLVNTNSLLTPLTGIGQYTYQICKALREIDLENQYTYYYGFFSPELFKAEASGGEASAEQKKINFYKQLKTQLKKIPLVGPAGRELRTALSRGMQFFTSERFDLYFEPNFIPLREIYAAKTVTMVFDLSVTLHPEWHPEERVRIFKRQFAKGLQKSAKVLTATQFVKGQIIEHLKVPEEQIEVTPISCNKDIFRPGTGEAITRTFGKTTLPKDYIVFVGSIEPRKNILGLLSAYVLLPENVKKNLSIVFCGPEGWKNSAVHDFIDKNKLKEKIVFLHYISDDDLARVYRGAVALVYPSFYEGFGLPPLEAMCCGCPAIVSDIPPHRELCGDAALYAQPARPEEIAKGIEAVYQSAAERMRLREAGLARAELFSWERAASQTLQVFNRVQTRAERTA